MEFSTFTVAHALTGALPASVDKASFVNLDVQAADWGVLGAFVAVLLAVDLWRNRDHAIHPRNQVIVETLFWVATAVVFGAYVAVRFGQSALGEYANGYLIEKSLSIDNVFVWSIVLSAFSIPLRYQHKVLFWGIFGAIAMRFAFIFAGSALIEKFWWTVLFFGALLVVTGVKVLRHTADEGHNEDNLATRLVARFIPTSATLDGHRFFTTGPDPKTNKLRKLATPLLTALVVVEITDVVFAVDSVPAILAVSREPFIVLSSNVFAILGLRSLYFLLANAKERLHYLSHALGVILLFVGAKMLASHWYHVPTSLSLGVIVVSLAVATWFSLRREIPVSEHGHDQEPDRTSV